MAKSERKEEKEQSSAQAPDTKEPQQASGSDPEQARQQPYDGAPPQEDGAETSGESRGYAEQSLFGPFKVLQGDTPHGFYLSEHLFGGGGISATPMPGIGQQEPMDAGSFQPLQLFTPPPPPRPETTLYDDDTSEPEPNLFASLYSQQWALNNTEYPGVDLNVLTAWEEFTGKGVLVGVIDDGLEYTHPDLIDNYAPAYGYDAKLKINDPSPKNLDDNHGTNCASLIVAANNGIGIVGVAHEASLGFSRMDFVEQSSWDSDAADAANSLADADVVSMSYGDTRFGTMNLEEGAYYDLATNGRGGLGTALFQAVGNSRGGGEMGTYEEFSALHYVNQVAAINPSGEFTYFSTPSPTLLVTAPGSEVWMADRLPPNGYNPDEAYDKAGGTSYSTPMVSGVAVLMLEANPNLGYRDVQTILAMTARKTANADDDPNMPWTWQVNGADNWNGGGMHVSHDYGFGLADATAAVRLAESWDQGAHTEANVQTVSGSASPAAAVPDVGQATSTVTMASNFTVEYGVVELTISGGAPSELVVTLESAAGTTSWLVNNPPESWDADFTHTFNTSDTFPFGTTQVKGENGQGDWTLTVEDTETGTVHTLESWTLTLYGEAESDDDLYVFTNEYSDWAALDGSRTTLTDGAGIDTLNVSAVTMDSYIDLSGTTASTVDGTALIFGGGTVIEKVHTGDGDDTLIGNAADNELFGWRGNDVLNGGLGADSLTGGAGSDLFHYSSTAHGNDRVFDFSHEDDAFSFDFSQFGQSSTGTLAADRFFIDDGLVDVSDACFVFEADILWYDSDGAGGVAQVKIAEVAGDDVTSEDILFV